jgi:hypothetical protein
MKKTEIISDELVIMGDSPKVLKEYYEGKLLLLERELNRLTILEHPVQIIHICQQIISVKSKLKRLNDVKEKKLKW